MDLIKRSAYYFSISYGWLSCQNSSQTTFEIHLFAHFFAICYKNKNKKKRWGQIPRAVKNLGQKSWVGTTTSSNSQERISGFWQTRDEISWTKKKKRAWLRAEMGVVTMWAVFPTDHPTLGKVYLGAGGIFEIFTSMDYTYSDRHVLDCLLLCAGVIALLTAVLCFAVLAVQRLHTRINYCCTAVAAYWYSGSARYARSQRSMDWNDRIHMYLVVK